MTKQIPHKTFIPQLRALVWLIGLLCTTFGLILPPQEDSINQPIIVSILGGYGIILFESIISFIDISLREKECSFKASVFWIFAVIMFHFATTFPFSFILYLNNDIPTLIFTILIVLLIGYISCYKWFIEYIDKNIDFWITSPKEYTILSQI